MPSSGRTKEFILITVDEYSSLVASKISNDNHIFVNPNDTRSRSPEICAKSNLENSNDTPRDFPRASECAQMNLKTRFGKATTSTLSDAKRTEDAATAVKSEIVILDLLSCGLSGGKIEQARQILRKSAIVSMFLSTTFLGETAYTTQTQDWQFQVLFPIFKYLLKRLTI